MLFDSTESLYRNLAKLRLRDPNDRIDAVTAPFHDYHDPEINRLFASSPPAPDEMVSYNFERDNKKKVSALACPNEVIMKCLQDQYKEKMRERLSESEVIIIKYVVRFYILIFAASAGRGGGGGEKSRSRADRRRHGDPGTL